MASPLWSGGDSRSAVQGDEGVCWVHCRQVQPVVGFRRAPPSPVCRDIPQQCSRKPLGVATVAKLVTTYIVKQSAAAASTSNHTGQSMCMCIHPANLAPAAAAEHGRDTQHCAPEDVDRMARKATRWLMAYSRPTQPCGPRPNVRKCLLQDTSSLRSSLKRSGSNLCASLYPCACRDMCQAAARSPSSIAEHAAVAAGRADTLADAHSASRHTT